MTDWSVDGDCSGELLAETMRKLALLLLSSLGSLYSHSGGIGDRLGGPSGRVVSLDGGELLGVEVVGDDTITLSDEDGSITAAGMWVGKDDNASVTGGCPELSVSC